MMKSDVQKLATKIVAGADCWEWDGAKLPSGRGRVAWRGGWWLAYRAVYTWLRGPIPVGMTLDHLCRNVGCVRPEHLEPVTQKVNCERAMGDACKHGHPWTEANTGRRRQRGGQIARVCRTCAKIRNARSLSRLRIVR